MIPSEGGKLSVIMIAKNVRVGTSFSMSPRGSVIGSLIISLSAESIEYIIMSVSKSTNVSISSTVITNVKANE